MIALVAGATRGTGRGIAVALGAAGATVYCTGSSDARAALGDEPAGDDRGDGRAGRPPPAAPASRCGSTTWTRHRSRRWSSASTREQGRLDVLVNDIWGGEPLWEWDDAGLEARSGQRPAPAQPGDRHAPHHQPPRAAAADPQPGRPGGRGDRRHPGYNATHYRVSLFYDLAKIAGQPAGLRPGAGAARRTAARRWRSRRASCARRSCWSTSASPRRTGARRTARPALRRLRDARLRRAARSPPWPPTRTGRWSGRSVASGELAQEYGFTDVDGSRPDVWRYMVEVQEAGKEADPEDYR